MAGYGLSRLTPALYVVGWTLTGLLVGMSIAAFDGMASFITGHNAYLARRKFVRCMIGGALGGLLGGVLAETFRAVLGAIFRGKDPLWLWSPDAMGFVALGAGIGLFIGLAQKPSSVS
jgi:hypothetical protein